MLETSLALLGRAGEGRLHDLQEFCARGSVETVPFGPEHVALALDAFRRFGEGRHPAGLNFGDCFSYALARATGEPLLFKGDDFSRTDIKPAVSPTRCPFSPRERGRWRTRPGTSPCPSRPTALRLPGPPAGSTPDAAQRVAETIDRVVASLGDMATGRPGRVTGTTEKVVPGLPSIVAYEVTDQPGRGRVAILHVIHGARDWPDEGSPA